MAATDFFRVRLWAVIGPPDSGKSSVIGTLVSQTGRGRGGARTILLRGDGWLLVHAFRQSMQEARFTPQDVADKVIGAARRRQGQAVFAYHNVLLALRSDNQTGLPTAKTYLTHFIRIGWEDSVAVLLEAEEYDRYARYGAPLAYIENSAEQMADPPQRNWVFGAVRNHFGWA